MKRSYFVILASTVSAVVAMACSGAGPALALGDAGDAGDGGAVCGCEPGPQGPKGDTGDAGPQGPQGPSISKAKVYLVTATPISIPLGKAATTTVSCNNPQDVLLSSGVTLSYQYTNYALWSCTPVNVNDTSKPAGADCTIHNDGNDPSSFVAWAMCISP